MTLSETLSKEPSELMATIFSQKGSFIFYHEIRELLGHVGFIEYFPDDWRLFVDSSKAKFEMYSSIQF